MTKERYLALCEIVHSFIGCVIARKRAESSTEHRYPTLSLRYFAEHDVLRSVEMDMTSFVQALSEKENEFVARENDVIVRLGYPYGARVIEQESFAR